MEDTLADFNQSSITAYISLKIQKLSCPFKTTTAPTPVHNEIILTQLPSRVVLSSQQVARKIILLNIMKKKS
jgi:hypothetical protein